MLSWIVRNRLLGARMRSYRPGSTDRAESICTASSANPGARRSSSARCTCSNPSPIGATSVDQRDWKSEWSAATAVTVSDG